MSSQKRCLNVLPTQLPFEVTGSQTIPLVVGPEPQPALLGLEFDPIRGPGLGETVNATLTIGNVSTEDITITAIARGSDTCISAIGSPAVQAIALTESYDTTISLTADTDPGCEGFEGNLVLDVTYTDEGGTSRTTTLERKFYIGAIVELQTDTTPETIPDYSGGATPLLKSLTFSGVGTVGGLAGVNAIELRLQFDHTSASDCSLFLRSPDGTRRYITGFSNDPDGSLDVTFTESTHPNLADMIGKDINGTWIVEIIDNWGGDEGTMNVVELTLGGLP